MSTVAARLRGRRDSYAVCPEDGFWFRPMYTGGKCPLCGEEAAGGEPRLPFLVGVDRFWVAMAVLVLSAVAMSALVLVLYFR